MKAIFAVARKAMPTAKSGKTYLAATLVDRTGELEARSFDRVEELSAALRGEGPTSRSRAPSAPSRASRSSASRSIVKVDPAAAGIDAAEFAWVAPPEPRKPEKAAAPRTRRRDLDGAARPRRRRHRLAREGRSSKAFLADEDFAARLRRSPAAKSVHHAYAGGLLEHTVRLHQAGPPARRPVPAGRPRPAGGRRLLPRPRQDPRARLRARTSSTPTRGGWSATWSWPRSGSTTRPAASACRASSSSTSSTSCSPTTASWSSARPRRR